MREVLSLLLANVRNAASQDRRLRRPSRLRRLAFLSSLDYCEFHALFHAWGILKCEESLADQTPQREIGHAQVN